MRTLKLSVLHLLTQVNKFCLCYLLNAKKDRTTFVSTYVTKWKASQESLN